MTRNEQIEHWKLEAIRPRLEVQARFLLELQRRGLRPSQVQFTRMWRRKRVEAHFSHQAYRLPVKGSLFVSTA